MISVINRHRDHRSGIYIGRGTVFGNPHKAEGGVSRRQACERFRRDAYDWLDDPHHPFTLALYDLKAQHDAGHEVLLVCSCKPLACHGDVIVELIEELD